MTDLELGAASQKLVPVLGRNQYPQYFFEYISSQILAIVLRKAVPRAIFQDWLVLGGQFCKEGFYFFWRRGVLLKNNMAIILFLH